MLRPIKLPQVLYALSDVLQPPGHRPVGHERIHAHQPHRIAAPHPGEDHLLLIGQR